MITCRADNGTTHNATDGDKFAVSPSCAFFDFAVYTVAMGTLCALGVLGNCVSFAVLLRDRGRSATSFLLQALSLTDTLVLVAAVPLYVLPPVHLYTGHLDGYYEAYLGIMPVLWPLYLIPYTGTVFVTVLVSLHRYCAVCKPFRGVSKAFTCKQAKSRVIGIVIFSVVYNIPRFFEYETVEVCEGGGTPIEVGETLTSTPDTTSSASGDPALFWNSTRRVFDVSDFGQNRLFRIVYTNVLYFVVIHGGPLLLIGFFNVQLILALKRRQQRWAEMGKGWYQQDISVVLVAVMCVFLLCQTPTFVDHVLWTVVDDRARFCGNWHYYYTAVSDTLAILNSSVNFVVYALTSRNFRHGLMIQSVSSGAASAAGIGAASRVDYYGMRCSRSALSTLATVGGNHVGGAGAAGTGEAVGHGGAAAAPAQNPNLLTVA